MLLNKGFSNFHLIFTNVQNLGVSQTPPFPPYSMKHPSFWIWLFFNKTKRFQTNFSNKGRVYLSHYFQLRTKRTRFPTTSFSPPKKTVCKFKLIMSSRKEKRNLLGADTISCSILD